MVEPTVRILARKSHSKRLCNVPPPPSPVQVVEPRLAEIEKAYLEKDFSTFGKITMQDSNQFHATCLDTYPPIFYMNDVSRWVRECFAASAALDWLRILIAGTVACLFPLPHVFSV